ncbi:cytochrome b [Rhizobium straminoryzae]|uniref:Cytochrome b n=1 Tax=Rhizobium straminoryzae TaxID=1387186 RepID=A0A549T6L3_9HYPH|nr:cytochrome b [Rhizobium straminoryzae]TRL37486.1 cytochrome b [Rhizobium straminoryzae]
MAHSLRDTASLTPSSALVDNDLTYGTVTRVLHWGMALLFAWQFVGMTLKLVLGRTPLVGVFTGTHASVGTILMALAIPRALWGISNLARRPPHGTGFVALAARLGHLGLYALMLIVPLLALLRAYGSGRGVAVFGLPVLPGAPEKVQWMVDAGHAAHGLLAWTLLALVAGHVGMVIVHRYIWKDDVLHRMAGRRADAFSAK